MNAVLATMPRIGPLLNPFRYLDRWLLSHVPMIWAERYHVALALALAIDLAVMLLGFAQASSAGYSLGTRLSVPLENVIPAIPWCIAIAWAWIRARGYGSLPLVKVNYGLHHSVLDLAVLAILLLTPPCYTWAFRTGLQARAPELKAVINDESILKAVWPEWQKLLSADVSRNDVDAEIKKLSPDKQIKGYFDASSERYTRMLSKLPAFDDLLESSGNMDPLQRAGIVASNLKASDTRSRTEPEFLAERAKLENVLAPLALKYMSLDIGPYVKANHDRSLTPKQLAELSMAVDRADTSFTNFHESITRFNGQPEVDSVEDQTWVAFPVLLTLLAIPAVTARVYWMTWALLMTGAAVSIYFMAVFSGIITARVTAIVGYGLLAATAAMVVVALTVGKIGKHTIIKMICVVAPVVILLLFYVVLSKMHREDDWRFSWATLAVTGVISRLMFNRLRALPEPY